MFEQIGIALTGVIAIWLSQDTRESHRKWSSVFGCIAQPFWFIATWKAQQWGMFFLCFFYTAAWFKGFYNYWIKK